MQKLWNIFQGSLRGVDSSKRLALGVALGAVAGLLPKDSLLCYFFIVLLVLTTANLLCSIISGIVVSIFSTALDGWSSQIGNFVLHHEALQSTWAWLATMPIVPWTRFNNTVVMGSLVIGLLAIIPLYYISYYLFDTFGKAISKRLAENPMVGWLVETPPTSPQQS